LRIYDITDDGTFPVRIEKTFTQFQGEGLESEVIREEEIMVVFDPVVNFYVLEGHQYVLDFVLIWDFAFAKVGIEILDELGEYCRRYRSSCKNGWGFVRVMKLYGSHVMKRGSRGCGGHREAVVRVVGGFRESIDMGW
jgi:hypothetical protein